MLETSRVTKQLEEAAPSPDKIGKRAQLEPAELPDNYA